MTVKEHEEKKSQPWLGYFRDLFVDASTWLKQLFTASPSTFPGASTASTGHLEIPTIKDQEYIPYESSYLLILPPGIRNKFLELSGESHKINAPLLSHAGNHSILAVLNINNMYFWGLNNVGSVLALRDLHDLKSILNDQKNISAYSPFLLQPEADAILKAFRQRIIAERATMIIYRKPCNLCARREFNTMHLRRLLPILSLKELTVYTTNSMGRISKLVLSPFPSNVSQQHSVMM